MPSTDTFVLGTEARLISASPENPKRILNAGASTIGRKATNDVTISDNALTTGQSYTAESAFWYVSAASSRIFVFDAGVAVSGGSYRSPDIYTHSGAPVSGTSYGNPVGQVDNGGLLLDSTNGNLYVNENTLESPYWTPISFTQPGINGVIVDQPVGPGVPLAGTTADIVGHGVRVFGQGIEVNDDSGFIGAADGAGVAGSSYNVMHVTNETLHLTALGANTGMYTPAANGTLAVECTWTDNADILTSSVFLGFVGEAVDLMDPAVSGATTTATFNIDSVCGWYSDSSMTDANGGFMVSEKANTAGTQTSLVTTVDRAAAATYQTLRVEVATDGRAILFANKAEVGIIPGATGAGAHSASTVACVPATALVPVFYIENATTTTRTANVKSFKAWGTR